MPSTAGQIRFSRYVPASTWMVVPLPAAFKAAWMVNWSCGTLITWALVVRETHISARQRPTRKPGIDRCFNMGSIFSSLLNPFL